MNRDIEFRGKHIHILKENEKLNGTWVYGYLCDENYIYSEKLGGDILVDKSTIGQYTGLKDKNGKKIFEGDILKRHFINGGENIGNRYIKVVWNEKNCSFNINHITSNNYEIIGNIYENDLESKGE